MHMSQTPTYIYTVEPVIKATLIKGLSASCLISMHYCSHHAVHAGPKYKFYIHLDLCAKATSINGSQIFGPIGSHYL